MRHDVNVLVVGAGVAGLTSAIMLAEAGFAVTVVDRVDRAASGPSAHNEGWLHRGTYHAVNLADPEAATQVARQCILGFDWFNARVPEALENREKPVITVLMDGTKTDLVESRWRGGGVSFRSLSPGELARAVPELRREGIARAYETGDCAFDAGYLHRRLLLDAWRLGVDFCFGVTWTVNEQGEISMTGPDRLRTDFDVTVLAIGYAAARLPISLPPGLTPGLWKSHLLWGRSSLGRSIVCVDSGEASIMVHDGGWCVVGVNDDDVPVDRPDHTADPGWQAVAEAAVHRLLTGGALESPVVTACMKIDVQRSPATRSVHPHLYEIDARSYLILPGKLTVAPVVSAQLVRRLSRRFAHPLVDMPTHHLLEREQTR